MTHFAKKYLAVLVALGVIFGTCYAHLAAAQTEKPEIVFISPFSSNKYHPFFSEFENAMAAAAENLGYRLTVSYAEEDHYHMLDTLSQVVAQKPAAVVFMAMKGNGEKALDILESGKVTGFMVNAGLTDEQYAKLGGPREKYKYWVGEMLPDDEKAGYILAESLFSHANKAGLKLANDKVMMIGVEANSSDGASVNRKAGLERYAAEQPDLDLIQVVRAKWERDTAKKIMAHLLERHETVHTVWSASDAMALGAVEAAVEKGQIPGKDILAAGVDWSVEGFDAIEKGLLVASAGGHVMEGAWAVVILHDYLNGIDFAESEGVRMKSPMYIADADNLADIRARVGTGKWKEIDFRQFSKFENPGTEKYDFTPLLPDNIERTRGTE